MYGGSVAGILNNRKIRGAERRRCLSTMRSTETAAARWDSNFALALHRPSKRGNKNLLASQASAFRAAETKIGNHMRIEIAEAWRLRPMKDTRNGSRCDSEATVFPLLSQRHAETAVRGLSDQFGCQGNTIDTTEPAALRIPVPARLFLEAPSALLICCRQKGSQATEAPSPFIPTRHMTVFRGLVSMPEQQCQP
jgi:hypothetical protein